MNSGGSSSNNSALSLVEREELIQLRSEVAGYEVEFKSLVRKLETKIEQLEKDREHEIESELSKAREELAEVEGRRATEALERGVSTSSKVQSLELQVEPSSFFVNERTSFIQWSIVSLLLMGVGELLFASARESVSKSALIAGNFIFVFALVVVNYAAARFYRSIFLMTNAKPYGYSDMIGPFLFAVFCSTGIGLILWWTNTNFNHANPALVQQEGVCVKRHLGGINLLEFEPSDLELDEKNGLLLVACPNHIVAIPDWLSTSTEDAKHLYRSPNGVVNDFEAIKFIDEVLYAVSEASENNDMSQIVEFGEDVEEGKLYETNRWRTRTLEIEGMAYIPTWFPEPRLILAGLSGSDNLRMQSYYWPLPGNSSVETPVEIQAISLNSDLFSQNLVRQQVSAAQYFEGYLYLLFYNAQLIRAFDSNGNIVKEWKLPVGVEGFEREWEGMQFQRKGAELVLHLALDTPAQVWSLLLDGGSVQGDTGWSLPSCAS